MSPDLLLGVVIALSVYLAGMPPAHTALTWLYGEHALQYPDVRKERRLNVLLWPPLLILNGFIFIGIFILVEMSRHPTSRR